ncbi:dihydrofolate reductase family protein [Streptomyces mangrovisoli]|uniref:Deaminase n=1 Tax=Streptomyces mangrovisoli TaxID=1428628 RepID=A0A1J4NN80_9ACTN|nr:dihydrofolate reductase family protein [Streptomyces mangrovisoli]OIJ63763.1 deaminase [Streptomyces mangrovisoli]
MRKIVLMMSVSLDGYFEGPGGDIGWHRVDEEVHRHMNDLLGPMSAFLSGRVTHELMAGFWPTADADPNAPATVAEFAGIWRDKTKYVYSRTLRHADRNTTVIREVVPEDVMALKAEPGGDMAVGGADLAAAFLRHGLVDQFHILVHPVLVGGGRRLFPDADELASLRLVDSRQFGNGVVMLRYDSSEVRFG